MTTPFYRRPSAYIPCAVLVYLCLAPAGHLLTRKQLKDWESEDPDSKHGAAHVKHKHEASKGHEHEHEHEHATSHTKAHHSEAHDEAKTKVKAEGQEGGGAKT